MPQQSQETPADALFHNGPSILWWLCRTWATSIEVFLHRDMGERYLGLQAAAVLLLVPLFGIFWEGYDLRPLICFLPAYLVMVAITRIGIIKRQWRGEQVHSYYTGWPRGMTGRGKWSELTVKRYVLPVFTLMLGWLIRQEYNAPLGTYIMIGGVCMHISVQLSDIQMRTRALDMHDAVTEQEIVAERFREMRGDNE